MGPSPHPGEAGYDPVAARARREGAGAAGRSADQPDAVGTVQLAVVVPVGSVQEIGVEMETGMPWKVMLTWLTRACYPVTGVTSGASIGSHTERTAVLARPRRGVSVTARRTTSDRSARRDRPTALRGQTRVITPARAAVRLREHTAVRAARRCEDRTVPTTRMRPGVEVRRRTTIAFPVARAVTTRIVGLALVFGVLAEGVAVADPFVVNVAVTDRAWSTVMVQVVAVPLQAPLQPTKDEVESGAAVRVTLVPERYCAEQVAPQSMPVGDDVTEPDPVPAFARVNV